MKFNSTAISGVYVITPEPRRDERGWFARTFCKREFAEIGVDAEFVQLNQSFNRIKGTFRGMHYQRPPHAEKKLVRCVAGSICDFAVDLRKNSPTFLKTFAVELSAENMDMILIPEGVAHGFITLEDNTSLLYHHTAFYHPGSEEGVRFDDPSIHLKLPTEIKVMSDRDRSYPLLPPNFHGLQL